MTENTKKKNCFIQIYLTKSKVHPTKGHKGPEGEYTFSSTLSLTTALEGWLINATLQQL
jgi:hypothetical protein